MTYTARLKVFCDNKDLLSKLSYTLLNTTTQKSYGGKIDPNGGEFKHEVRQFQKSYDNQQAEQISLMV